MKYKKLAKKALNMYNINVLDMAYLSEETNVFYHIFTEDKDYVLKIYQEESSNYNDNLSEHYLINIIKENTDIITPQVIKNIEGETITKIPYNNERGYKRLALYEYISGESIVGYENNQYFEEIGRQTAKMHLATENLVYPDYINPKKWDKIFYFENEEPVYKQKKYSKFITQEMVDILNNLIPYIDQKLKEFYLKQKPQLIHGDMNPWNIKKLNETYVIYDFEEGMQAYPIHDIAVFMYYYKFIENLDFLEVKKSFYRGYESIKSLPTNLDEKNLELIMMARRINLFNYVLKINPEPKEYITISFPKIKEYFLSYK